MSTSASQVPITREFLREFYKAYPVTSDSSAHPELHAALDAAVDAMATASEALHGVEHVKALRARVVLPTPHRIDESTYRQRQLCEEVHAMVSDTKRATFQKKLADRGLEESALGELSAQMASIAESTSRCGKRLVAFQKRNQTRAEEFARDFLPQDFRASILRAQRERTERKMAAEVTQLMSRGGTIKDKYDLLWKQQMSRRQQVVALGNASGIFKVFVKFIGGVPQTLLDFLRTINDDEGPLEECRLKYGPCGYDLVAFINKVHLALALCLDLCSVLPFAAERTALADGTETPEALASVTVMGVWTMASECVTAFEGLMVPFLDLLQRLFDDSPFFISAKEATLLQLSSDASSSITTTNVARGASFVLPVPLTATQVLEYEFRVQQYDVGFSVTTEEGGGEVVAYERVHADRGWVKGRVHAEEKGTFLFTFDNAYSMFRSKTVEYRLFLVNSAEDRNSETGSPLPSRMRNMSDAFEAIPPPSPVGSLGVASLDFSDDEE